MVSKPLGDTRSWLGNCVATVLFVSAWAWFLYQGVVDPHGGINSLWPVFGVANQLLAVIALALGTTVLIKMGRVRYLWVTLAPLTWLLAVTVSAGCLKIFSADPRIGFLSMANSLNAKIAAGGTEAQLAQWRQLVFNQYTNSFVTAFFLVLVVLVLLANVRVWYLLLTGRRQPDLQEAPYVAVQ